MNKLFSNLLVSSPNGGGIFLLRGNEIHKLDSINTTGLNIKGKKALRGIQPALLAIFGEHEISVDQHVMNFDDIHDVLIDGESGYLVGTMGNEIIQFDGSGQEIRRWTFAGEKDSWHINCIAKWNERIVFSAFGEFGIHREYKGKTQGSGFVQDLHTGERLITGLSQPHSLVPIGQNLLVASSQNREIIEYSPSGTALRSRTFEGYTRGICVSGNEIYVGLSLSRNEEDGMLPSATIAAIDKNTWEDLGRKSISAAEIYSIEFVPEENLGDVLPRLAAHSSRYLSEKLAERDEKVAELTNKLAVSEEQALLFNQTKVELEMRLAQLDETVAQQENTITLLNQTLVERDNFVRKLLAKTIGLLNQTLAERNTFIQRLMTPSSWRLTKALRFARRIIARRGVSAEDRMRLKQILRRIYNALPAPLQTIAKWGYTKLVRAPLRAFRRRQTSGKPFQAPAIRPGSQADGLPDYIVWGVIDWHFRHQRPQQMALALAKTGCRVFYISPNLRDDERAGFELEKLDEDGYLFQAHLYVSGAPSIYSASPSADDVAQLRASTGEMLEWSDSRRVICLVDHPFWYDVATVIPNSRVVYDCMDHHEGFDNNSSEILSLERSLLRDADLTITTSEWLDNLVSKNAARRALIRNAGDFEHFSRPPAIRYRDPAGRRVIGYYGAIAEWFDQELVEAVAKRFSDYCILLIGADTVNAKAKLGSMQNVKFIGEVPYDKLPYYLHGFDVCLLPFKILPLTLATNPVKAYEYLSAGKPVVSVDLPEMRQFGELVHVAHDAQEFLSSVEKLLIGEEPADAAGKRQAFAKEQTWAHRAKDLIRFAEDENIEPQISIIVVTYNNLELTRTCLASIDKYTDYTHTEVIVVDNASSDESPAFLSDWVKGDPHRKLILNSDNRGFAAANNQGLEIATGDYLILLNNDTHVTPGWARTLTRHLKRDASLGLIGPVTNNIGNEAKIDIQYQSMEEMLKAAAAFTRRHVGDTFPLRTAAFFCVAMPRSTYTRIGPLDEQFGRGFFEDDDYCRRVEEAGLRIACAEDVFIHHHLSASFNKLKSKDREALFEKNKQLYEAKWGKWIPHRYTDRNAANKATIPWIFKKSKYVYGQCNVCGKNSRFFFTDPALWRESLTCEHCLTTSRYRSISRGILRAINELNGVASPSLSELPRNTEKKLRVYDTQPPFYYELCAYPLPDMLKNTGWVDVDLSQYKPSRPAGAKLKSGITNQNLECLTFEDGAFDIVITSDVMEHVRLDERAHREIHRVLRPGGIYVFTVPHNRGWNTTLTRVQVTDPDDSSKDVHLLEPEYHGDTNNEEGGGVLAYRTYGRDLEQYLTEIGFEIDYSRDNIHEQGILNTEIYYCRKIQ